MKDRFLCHVWLMFVLALLLAVPGVLLADIVYLNTGGKVEGKIAEKTVDSIKVKTVGGMIDIPVDDIDSIKECECVFDSYEEKLKDTDEDDADARFELGLWCKEKGLRAEAKKHFEEVIALSPDHEKARAGLGYVRTDNGWEIPPPPKQKKMDSTRGKEQLVPPAARKKAKPRKPVKKKSSTRKKRKKFPYRKPGNYKENYTYEGSPQPYTLKIPGAYTGKKPLPLVILLHGAGGTADNFLRFVTMRGIRRNDLIMVAVENVKVPNESYVELVKTLLKSLNVDRKRIYMFGFSMGGWQTSRTALFLSEIFAAFVIAGAGKAASPPQADDNSPAAGLLVGKSDSVHGQAVSAYEDYKRKGYDAKFWDFDGGHTLPGSKLMNEVFDWMLSKKKKSKK